MEKQNTLYSTYNWTDVVQSVCELLNIIMVDVSLSFHDQHFDQTGHIYFCISKLFSASFHTVLFLVSGA